jgi:hypothetical protein
MEATLATAKQAFSDWRNLNSHVEGLQVKFQKQNTS